MRIQVHLIILVSYVLVSPHQFSVLLFRPVFCSLLFCLASGAISATGTVSNIADAWRSGQVLVIVSAPLLDELERTFQKPYFRRYLTDTQSSRFMMLLQRRATVSPITVSVQGIATHPEDDLILATAVSGKANYLVTGDIKLQQVGTYHRVRILSPRRFLETLKHEASEK